MYDTHEQNGLSTDDFPDTRETTLNLKWDSLILITSFVEMVKLNLGNGKSNIANASVLLLLLLLFCFSFFEVLRFNDKNQ